VNNYADNVVAQQLTQVDGVALVLIAGARGQQHQRQEQGRAGRGIIIDRRLSNDQELNGIMM
jgi:hypothetical protein